MSSDKIMDAVTRDVVRDLQDDRDRYRDLWEGGMEQLRAARGEGRRAMVWALFVGAFLGMIGACQVVSYNHDNHLRDLAQCQRVLLDFSHALDRERGACGSMP